VEHESKPVASVETGFNAAAERAKVHGISPHTLRHTAVTWMVMAGDAYTDGGTLHRNVIADGGDTIRPPFAGLATAGGKRIVGDGWLGYWLGDYVLVDQ
jgi:hypothetical protein